MNELLAAAAGGLLALAGGLATPPREGPPLLVDAMLDALRSWPALGLLGAVGLALTQPDARPALLATAAFLPVYLQAVHAMRRVDAGGLALPAKPCQRQRALWQQAAPCLVRASAAALALCVLLALESRLLALVGA